MSTPRSGSTLLMEMIAEQPFVLPVREPLNLRRKYIEDTLGLHKWEEIYSFDNYQHIVKYLQSFRFNLTVDSRFKREKPFSHTWHPVTSRLAYKILHGLEHKADELFKDLNAKTVILIRHPIPVSLSREELPRYNAFLQSDVSEFFSKEQLKFASQSLKSGTQFEKSIISWCFQNKLLLQKSERNLLITYEELVMNREPVIQKLAEYLNLPKPDKMLLRSLKPSGSTDKSSQTNKELLQEVQKGSASFLQLINKWKGKVDMEMVQNAQNILNLFDIDIYTAEEIMPSPKYLISGKK